MTRRRGPSVAVRPRVTQPITPDFLADAVAYLRGRSHPANHVTVVVVDKPADLARIPVAPGLVGRYADMTDAGTYLVDVAVHDIVPWLARHGLTVDVTPPRRERREYMRNYYARKFGGAS